MAVRIAGAADLPAAFALRVAVFAGEQGIPAAADRDGRDDDALQLVAIDDAGAVVGTCRVLVEDGVGRFGRLCVRPDARRRGLAAALLAAAEREAVAAGARRMRLHAQTSALGLYERAGYVAQGAPFDEEGVEHLTMERALA